MKKQRGDLKAQVSGAGKNKLLQATVLEVLGNRIAVQMVSNGKKLIGIPFIGGPISVGKIVYINYASGQPVAECRGEASELTQSKPRSVRTVRTEFTPEQVGGASGTGSVGLHAATHASGATDPVKLDDLAAPDDNTDLDASASAHGLLPKLSGDSGDVLLGDGTWGAGGGGGGGGTAIVRAFASATSTDAHTSNNTWEDINSMSVSITTQAVADIVVDFDFYGKPASSNWEHIALRAVIGATNGDTWLVYRVDSNANQSIYQSRHFKHVFEDVAAGTYTVKIQWHDNNSSLDYTFYNRVLSVIAYQGSGTGSDAADITYTPAAATDWDSDTDPGNIDGALDQLAERVDDLETVVVDASDVTYTPSGSISATDVQAAIEWLDALDDPDTPPTSGDNPSLALSYTGDDVTEVVATVRATPYTTGLAYTRDGDGNLTQIEKTIGAVTYTKTLTWVAGKLTAVSAWS